ncbi:cytochrome P450 family protein [Nocardiopsis nanhaiensis]
MHADPAREHPGWSRVPLYQPVQGDRDTYWQDMRQSYGPIAPVLLEPGVHAWLLLSYKLNKEVLANDDLYARDPRWWRDMVDGTISPDSGTRAVWHKRPTALLSDGAEHQRLAGALSMAFARLQQQRVLEQMTTVAHALIDEFAADGQVDLIGQYARLLPLHVLCRLFGMGPPQIAAITEQMSLIWQGHPGAMAAVKAMGELLHEVAQRARTEPNPAALPTLLLDQGLSEHEVGEQLGLVVSAAADPVTHTIGMALRQLLSDPDLATSYASSTLLIAETVNLVQVRHSPLETIVARFPRRDVHLGGQLIRQGDCLVAGFAPAAADLYRGMDLDQVASNRAHLAFGAGAHQCPRYGRDLASAMAETAIEVLTHRLSDLRLATLPATHRWLPTSNLRGLVDLPARFTPESPHRSPTSPHHQQEQAWTPHPPPPNPSSSTPPEPTTTPTPKHKRSWRPARWRPWNWLTGSPSKH